MLFQTINGYLVTKAIFTQKITNPKKKVINYSGKVSFSDKVLLKWEYVKPTKKKYVRTDMT